MFLGRYRRRLAKRGNPPTNVRRTSRFYSERVHAMATMLRSALVGTLALLGSAAMADDNNRSEAGSTEKARQIHRASKLLKHNLANDQDQKLGGVADLVFDETGRACYLILGNRYGVTTAEYTAIPWSLVRPQFDGDHCMTSLTSEKISGAPKFTRDNYYDRWTKEWCEQVHAYFNVDDKKNDSNTASTNKPREMFYASQLLGGTVQNSDQHKLATVDDLIFTAPDKIGFVVMGSGGILNIGEKLLAAPKGAVQFKKGERGSAFTVVNLTKTQLEGAPQLTSSDYHELMDQGFVDRVASFYGSDRKNSGVPSDQTRSKE